MTESDADFSGMIAGGQALGDVLDDLEARANRFGRALTGALASAVEGGRGLDDILKATGTRLIDIALSAGLKPLQDTVSAGMGGVLGEVAGAVAGGSAGGGSGGVPGGGSGGRLSARSAGGLRQAAGRTVPALAAGGLAAPVFLRDEALQGGEGLAAARAVRPFPPEGRGGAGVVPNVVFNVTARDVDGFRKSEGQIAAMLTRVVGRGRRGV